MSALSNFNPLSVMKNTISGSTSYQSLAFRAGDAMAKSALTYLTLKACEVYQAYVNEIYQATLIQTEAMRACNPQPESWSLKKMIFSSSKNIFLTTIIALGIINIPAHIWGGSPEPGQAYSSFKSRTLLTGLIVLTTYALHEIVPKISPETTLLSSLTTTAASAAWAIANVAWPMMQLGGNLIILTCKKISYVYSWLNN